MSNLVLRHISKYCVLLCMLLCMLQWADLCTLCLNCCDTFYLDCRHLLFYAFLRVKTALSWLKSEFRQTFRKMIKIKIILDESESDVKCIFDLTHQYFNKYYLSVSPILAKGFSNFPVNICSTILLCDLTSNFNVWLKISSAV